eukprot:TRINITY_DN2391_c0_g1_i13.p1 TRINITY_DN2391_c0_g1~~TRINITY_DN2391_c0_g1_i13.p1  ORF type:complete len:172 (-),score=24.13 TRINITY_DN2391_c0_g1_i13:173-688(-)
MLTQDEKEDALRISGSPPEPAPTPVEPSAPADPENKSCFGSLERKKRQIIFLIVCSIGMVLQIVAASIVIRDKGRSLGFGYAFCYTVGWQFLLTALIAMLRPEHIIMETKTLLLRLLLLAFLLIIILGYVLALAARTGGFTLVFVFLSWAVYAWYLHGVVPGGLVGVLPCF